MTDVWTVARIAILRTRWAAGETAAAIANELACGVSRSAVLGKVMRLKLPPRENGNHPTKRQFAIAEQPSPKPKPGKIASLSQTPQSSGRRNQTNSLAEKLAIAEAEPGLPEKLKGEKPDGTGIKFAALNANNCHWPKGDPLDEDFEFCGAVAIPGMPYCAGHCRLSYTPAVSRRSAEQLNSRLNRARPNDFYQR
ncbi:hypothetical protein LJR220_003380 [Bradyrhizobium sp. LjRoot220]|uniref:GcrA family cell cycle regulator n=1 Tax=Bradyrhizobium sp. LjRoot220 TaxID=3342284 RepID=UPI003ECCE599